METVAWGNTPLKYGLATGVPKTITNSDELHA
jgi:hypothetical protein